MFGPLMHFESYDSNSVAKKEKTLLSKNSDTSGVVYQGWTCENVAPCVQA